MHDFGKHFRARPGSDYDSKSAQDGLRVDQPEWSEFASLEEPIEGDGWWMCFFLGKLREVWSQINVFHLPDLCWCSLLIISRCWSPEDSPIVLTCFFLPKSVCIFKHAGNVCSWCRPLVLEGIGLARLLPLFNNRTFWNIYSHCLDGKEWT